MPMARTQNKTRHSVLWVWVPCVLCGFRYNGWPQGAPDRALFAPIPPNQKPLDHQQNSESHSRTYRDKASNDHGKHPKSNMARWTIVLETLWLPMFWIQWTIPGGPRSNHVWHFGDCKKDPLNVKYKAVVTDPAGIRYDSVPIVHAIIQVNNVLQKLEAWSLTKSLKKGSSKFLVLESPFSMQTANTVKQW